MKIKRWHIALGILISAVFLYLAFRKIEFDTLWQYLRSAKWAQFPSGGSLVSGRGGFRPGFNSQNGWRQFVYDFRKARFKLIPDSNAL